MLPICYPKSGSWGVLFSGRRKESHRVSLYLETRSVVSKVGSTYTHGAQQVFGGRMGDLNFCVWVGCGLCLSFQAWTRLCFPASLAVIWGHMMHLDQWDQGSHALPSRSLEEGGAMRWKDSESSDECKEQSPLDQSTPDSDMSKK